MTLNNYSNPADDLQFFCSRFVSGIMKKEKKDRREFLKVGLGGFAAAVLMDNVKAEEIYTFDDNVSVELKEATIADLQAKMRSGALTARRITEMYLARIREIDPKLRSVIELNPDALAIADAMDKERKKGKVRSPLHGIPILIKDNIDTADKMKTTAGSLALVDAPTPKEDAFVVKKLRAAGAIILGKTNLSEWANFRGNKSISGWSGRGGQTNNVYYLDKNPCGSSAGSGVAVSANFAAAAVGTETNGSIICPSLRNGVVGIKPTLGLVSRVGIIPIAHTQDTAGPMARTVADAAILLGALAGRDKNDAETADADKKRVKDYTKFLEADGFRGARIGVAMQFTDNADMKEFMKPILEMMRAGGATVVDVTFPFDYSKIGDDRLEVLLYEFKTDLNKYLETRGAKYKTLADLIKFNEENKDKELNLFGQELFIEAEKRGALTDKKYLDALAKVKRAAREEGIDAVMTKDKLDAICAPTSGQTWAIAATAGYPYVTVPAGFKENPIGLSFFGRPFSEPSLIKYAYAFEQKSKARRVPEFLPTAPKTPK